MSATPLENMRKRAADYAALRDKLAAQVQAMKDEVSTIERASMPDILRTGRKIAALHSELVEFITDHPDCFVKPRTVVVDGLKFGLQKQRGKMTWDSDEGLCQRIDKLAAEGALTHEQAVMLVVNQPRPVAAALEQLDGKLLKRLGVTVTADTDAPLIKSVDGDVEKVVAAIVREAVKGGEVAV